MQQKLVESIQKSFDLAGKKFKTKFQKVLVEFNIRSNSGIIGQACFNPRKIRINPFVFKLYPAHTESITVPHEVAHIVAFDLYGLEGWNHGRLWQSVMTEMGQKADVKQPLITKTNICLPVYECSKCNKQVLCSKISHRKMQTGFYRSSSCRCGGNRDFMGRVVDLLESKKLTCLKTPEILLQE